MYTNNNLLGEYVWTFFIVVPFIVFPVASIYLLPNSPDIPKIPFYIGAFFNFTITSLMIVLSIYSIVRIQDGDEWFISIGGGFAYIPIIVIPMCIFNLLFLGVTVWNYGHNQRTYAQQIAEESEHQRTEQKRMQAEKLDILRQDLGADGANIIKSLRSFFEGQSDDLRERMQDYVVELLEELRRQELEATLAKKRNSANTGATVAPAGDLDSETELTAEAKDQSPTDSASVAIVADEVDEGASPPKQSSADSARVAIVKAWERNHQRRQESRKKTLQLHKTGSIPVVVMASTLITYAMMGSAYTGAWTLLDGLNSDLANANDQAQGVKTMATEYIEMSVDMQAQTGQPPLGYLADSSTLAGDTVELVHLLESNTGLPPDVKRQLANVNIAVTQLELALKYASVLIEPIQKGMSPFMDGTRLEVVEQWSQLVDEMSTNFNPVTKTAISLALVLAVVTGYLNYRSFAEDLFTINMGSNMAHVEGFNPSLFTPGNAQMFPGILYAVSLFGFYLTSILFTCVVLPFSTASTWTFVWDAVVSADYVVVTLNALGGTATFMLMAKVVGDRLLSDGHVITHRAVWSWYSGIMFAFSLIVGVVLASARVVQSIAVGIHSLFRINQTIIGKTDRAWIAYWSAIMLSHLHQLPKQEPETRTIKTQVKEVELERNVSAAAGNAQG